MRNSAKHQLPCLTKCHDLTLYADSYAKERPNPAKNKLEGVCSQALTFKILA